MNPAVVPHITDAIQQWIERVAKNPVSDAKKTPDVCIIEVTLIFSLCYIKNMIYGS